MIVIYDRNLFIVQALGAGSGGGGRPNVSKKKNAFLSKKPKKEIKEGK
jgi:hypothetical protein